MAASVQAPRQSNPFADRFRNKFVTSGTTAGDLNARATVVMPKQAPVGRPTVPAPVPMSQMPLYLQRQMPGFNQPVVTSRDTASIQEARSLRISWPHSGLGFNFSTLSWILTLNPKP